MTALLLALTVLEVVALVAALAIYLVLIARKLRSVAASLGSLSSAARALDEQGQGRAPGLAELNFALEKLLSELPSVVERAERVAGRR